MLTVIHVNLMSCPVTDIRKGRLMRNTRYIVSTTLFFFMTRDVICTRWFIDLEIDFDEHFYFSSLDPA